MSKFFELFNRKKLEYLISNYDDVSHQYFKDSNYKAALQTYLKNSKPVDDTYNEIQVTYSQINDGYGRQWAQGPSLQKFPRAIRELLCDDLYIDFDIKNCHPTILKQYCGSNDIKCSNLKKYCKHRDEVIDSLMKNYDLTRDEVKDGFNGIINGSYKFVDGKKQAFLEDLYNEAKEIRWTIYETEPEFKELGRKRNPHPSGDIESDENDACKSCFSYFLQTIENNILEIMVNYIKKNLKIKHVVQIFDGFMILKKDVGNTDELIKKLESEVKNETNYKISLATKPLEKKIFLDNEMIKNIDVKKCVDIWNILEDMNHSDMAKLYYKLNPSKYIFNNVMGWYEYNEYNILLSFNKSVPPSLLSDVTNKLQELIIEERNKLRPPTRGNSEEEYLKQMSMYDKRMKLAKKSYINIGSSTYIKNMIDYLSNLYHVNRLDTLLDANENLLAFDDKVFDLSTNSFRDIQPADYITKTTKFNVPKKNNEDFEFLNNLLYSIFENNEIVDYWLATTSSSLFGNKMESLFIHTGIGGNGKGLLSSMLVKALGDYMYCADNTFLTSVFKSGQANPTLAKCQGIRYLLVSEPDDGSEDVKFNVDFIKMLTGGDIITTRDLFKSNISYKPQFTPFVQCNNKPKLGKLDNGIIRRLKIINYPLKFTDNPKKHNERKIDYSLKQKLSDGLYKQFILLLIDKAVQYKNKTIVQPSDVQQETQEYFAENDPVKNYLETCCIITDENDQTALPIKSSELYDDYIHNGHQKISMVKFAEYMKVHNIRTKSAKGYKYYVGIKIKDKQEEKKNDLDV